jgi:hypothetical protein
MPTVVAQFVKQVDFPGSGCTEEMTGDKAKSLYTENDEQGNTFEIKCDGQLLGFFTKKGGKPVCVGKCIYQWGHNYINKKVLIEIEPTVTAVGDIKIKKPKNDDPKYKIPKEMQTITWKNIEPHGDPPEKGEKGATGPDFVGAKDILWIFDVKTGSYVTQNTENKGRWKKTGDEKDDWSWEVLEQKKLGDPSPSKKAPEDSKLFSMGGQTPTHGERCVAIPPDQFVAYTPAPFTFMHDGVPQTCVARLPVGSDEFEAERIEATVNKTFLFHFEMPHQEEEVITHELLEPPEGMTIGRLTGIIKWRPKNAQLGNHRIVVRHAYRGLTPHIDRFILRVNKGGG